MTTPHERARSLIQAGDLLRELSLGAEVPESLRRQAETVLRHYPSEQDFKLASELEERCREELELLADAHGSLHPVLVAWLMTGTTLGIKLDSW